MKLTAFKSKLLGQMYSIVPLDKPESIFFDKDNRFNIVSKSINIHLQRILLDPCKNTDVHKKEGSIFLGFSTNRPSGKKIVDSDTNENGIIHSRVPFWISSDIISSHILIGGSTGSGKTSLTYRLISGALRDFGTVIIGEAKGGKQGYANGSAFNDLATYLSNKLNVKYYRFPRGNCWFNPISHLHSSKQRRDFTKGIADTLPIKDGTIKAYIYQAAEIAALILDFSFYCYSTKIEVITFRHLAVALKDPTKIQETIRHVLDKIDETPKNAENASFFAANRHIVENIYRDLERLNFFAIGEPGARQNLILTASGINRFLEAFDTEDLLYYTESHSTGTDPERTPLVELKLNEILYSRAIVVISQPLDQVASKVIGPAFWDTLLAKVLQLGPYPEKRNDQPREKIAVCLDETHRLPVGKLGQSGDFLRQYNVGLIEITPSVIDLERWNANKHIYQTVISISPGIDEVLGLIYNHLPPYLDKRYVVDMDVNVPDLKVETRTRNTHLDPNYQENPGVAFRGLRNTGRFTALLQSTKIDNVSGLFWIDLEDPFFAKFEELVKQALKQEGKSANILDYVLGLADTIET